MQTYRVQTLEQVPTFVERSEAVDFIISDRGSAYEFFKLNCHTLPKPGKGLVKHYPERTTGFSHPQITRLVKQYVEAGYIKDGRSAGLSKPFQSRYTRQDIRLLAYLDKALEQLFGPLTRKVLRRQFEVFGDARFKRLCNLSKGHLPSLCKTEPIVTFGRLFSLPALPRLR